VRAAAAGDGPRVRRSAVLLALAGPCRLLERVAPDRSDHLHAKTRVNDATARAPFGSEVMQVIDEFLPPSSLLGDPAPAGQREPSVRGGPHYQSSGNPRTLPLPGASLSAQDHLGEESTNGPTPEQPARTPPRNATPPFGSNSLTMPLVAPHT